MPVGIEKTFHIVVPIPAYEIFPGCPKNVQSQIGGSGRCFMGRSFDLTAHKSHTISHAFPTHHRTWSVCPRTFSMNSWWQRAATASSTFTAPQLPKSNSNGHDTAFGLQKLVSLEEIKCPKGQESWILRLQLFPESASSFLKALK